MLEEHHLGPESSRDSLKEVSHALHGEEVEKHGLNAQRKPMVQSAPEFSRDLEKETITALPIDVETEHGLAAEELPEELLLESLKDTLKLEEDALFTKEELGNSPDALGLQSVSTKPESLRDSREVTTDVSCTEMEEKHGLSADPVFQNHQRSQLPQSSLQESQRQNQSQSKEKKLLLQLSQAPTTAWTK